MCRTSIPSIEDLHTEFKAAERALPCFRDAPEGFELSLPLQKNATPEETGQVTGQVTELLEVFSAEHSRKDLMAALKLRGRDHFEKAYLMPALQLKLIERTIPDKPRSRLQKYRLTPKGKNLLSPKP